MSGDPTPAEPRVLFIKKARFVQQDRFTKRAIGRPLIAGMLSLLFVCASVSVASAKGADDTDGAMGLRRKEYRKRRSSLRTAAGRWITSRKAFPSRCPLCKGSGFRLKKRGRRILRVKCHQCEGKGKWISRKHYRAVYYEMRTPAFRAIPDIQDQLTTQYNQVRRGSPWPQQISRYRFRSWELVDATHGIVWVLFDAARVPQATRWIWAQREGSKEWGWFLWSARVDGAWPTPGSAVQEERDGWTPLSAPEWSRLRKTVVEAQLTSRVVQSWKQGATLRVRLEPRGISDPPPFPFRVERDAGRLFHSLFRVHPDCKAIHTEWMVPWVDGLEREKQQVRWIATLDRSAFDPQRWARVKRKQWATFLTWTNVDHEGWTPKMPGTKLAAPLPGSTPPAESQPTPTNPPPAKPLPTDPTPSKPTPNDSPTSPPGEPPPAMPLPPKPLPTKPPPAKPTPPEPAEPDEMDDELTAELPPLTSKAKTAAAKILAKIELEYKAAAKEFNEGNVARRAGAHDVWQEKLDKAHMHLASIEDLWSEELVPAMPGKSELVREAVAEEHFSDFWDKVYEMKAMLRKLTSVR